MKDDNHVILVANEPNEPVDGWIGTLLVTRTHMVYLSLAGGYFIMAATKKKFFGDSTPFSKFDIHSQH